MYITKSRKCGQCEIIILPSAKLHCMCGMTFRLLSLYNVPVSLRYNESQKAQS